MSNTKRIITHDNSVSSARCSDMQDIVITKEGVPLNGVIKLADDTICRFKDGLLDGNVYDKDGNITAQKPAMEYSHEGKEFCKKGKLNGYPAVRQNFGLTEEDWDNGVIQELRTKTK